MERLPEICRGYKLEDIWNMDESGCFFRALPDRCLSEKGRRCKGGKHSKVRMTVAFIVSATGGKVTESIVIWKSKYHDVSDILITKVVQQVFIILVMRNRG